MGSAMAYLTALLASYLIAFLWSRGRVRDDRHRVRQRLEVIDRFDSDEARNAARDADNLIWVLGPTFLFGTLAGGIAGALIWLLRGYLAP